MVAYIVVIIIEGSLLATSMHPSADIGTRYARTNESPGTLGGNEQPADLSSRYSMSNTIILPD